MSAYVYRAVVNQTICAFPTDCFPVAANPRDSLCRDSKMDTYPSRGFDLQKQCGGGLCLNMALHFVWPVSLLHLHTPIHGIRNNLGLQSQLTLPLWTFFFFSFFFSSWEESERNKAVRECFWRDWGWVTKRAQAWREAGGRGRSDRLTHWVLYIISVQTDVALSSLCVGSRYRLSKLFLSLAGCT